MLKPHSCKHKRFIDMFMKKKKNTVSTYFNGAIINFHQKFVD